MAKKLHVDVDIRDWTVQQIFTYGLEFIRKQGLCMTRAGNPRYRSAATSQMCVVGCMIPDRLYSQSMENTSWAAMNTHMLEELLGIDNRHLAGEERCAVLYEMQNAHDTAVRMQRDGCAHDAVMAEFEFRMKRVAAQHKLEMQ